MGEAAGMEPTDRIRSALAKVGSRRVIWIDDHFNDSPAELAGLLWQHREDSLLVAPDRAVEMLEMDETAQDVAVERLRDLLASSTPAERVSLKDRLLDRLAAAEHTDGRELDSTSVNRACDLMGVAPEDRWTFDGAERRVTELCRAGDAEVAYVVDIKDERDNSERGLEILKALVRGSSVGVAFILTHEAAVDTEARREQDINRKVTSLDAASQRSMPFCLVAKARLGAAISSPVMMADGLEVAIKRAGLRKAVHAVLRGARQQVQRSFDEAQSLLMDVQPEQFERYVIRRCHGEGGSELHVIERALTAHMGFGLRTLFGQEDMQAEMTRLRSLQSIKLPGIEDASSVSLEPFRRHEVWEGEELINLSLAPIAPGDVFELDRLEKATASSSKRFVLLGSACDMQLRSTGKRLLSSAYLVPLISTPPGSAATRKKVPPQDVDTEPSAKAWLPFSLDGDELYCEFYKVAEVNMAVLDLASFRPDGRVRFDEGQTQPANQIPSQAAAYGSRVAAAKARLDFKPDPSGSEPAGGALPNFALQLAFRSDDMFRQLHFGSVEEIRKTQADGRQIVLPRRVSWRLRRCGRLRQPFPAYLFSGFLTFQGRYGFDHDFTTDA